MAQHHLIGCGLGKAYLGREGHLKSQGQPGSAIVLLLFLGVEAKSCRAAGALMVDI